MSTHNYIRSQFWCFFCFVFFQFKKIILNSYPADASNATAIWRSSKPFNKRMHKFYSKLRCHGIKGLQPHQIYRITLSPWAAAISFQKELMELTIMKTMHCQFTMYGQFTQIMIDLVILEMTDVLADSPIHSTGVKLKLCPLISAQCFTENLHGK